MRKLKFSSQVPAVKFTVSAEIEKRIEHLIVKVDRMERNVPEYMIIGDEVKENHEVYIRNIGLFRQEIKEVNAEIAFIKKDMKSIRRTQGEFVLLKKNLFNLSRLIVEITENLEWNITVFDNSGMYDLYFGPGGFYPMQEEREKQLGIFG